MTEQVDIALEGVVKEVRLALEAAVWFEFCIVSAVVLFRMAEALKAGACSEEDFRRHIGGDIRLRDALPVVASKFPDSEEILKRGAETRNRIVHDSGRRMGTVAMANAANLSLNPPLLQSATLGLIASTTDEVRKRREEMGEALKEARRIFGLAMGQVIEASGKIPPH